MAQIHGGNIKPCEIARCGKKSPAAEIQSQSGCWRRYSSYFLIPNPALTGPQLRHVLTNFFLLVAYAPFKITGDNSRADSGGVISEKIYDATRSRNIDGV
ncbi:hypothetical protein AVEN_175106-1 [Araneus ventricosus]|uniref:Uncharacterized protein n=1 Tax=Araneus ventricosus TaxID=182803 RepID=A0A4Y2A669_ARAVE|nr:hypothetical protein AVEN_175106-1 [Araneus ventricosus]